MNARVTLLAFALVAGAAAGFVHWKTHEAQMRMAAEFARRQWDAAEIRRRTDDTLQQLTDARSELQALLTPRGNRAALPAPAASSASSGGGGMSSPKNADSMPGEELRRLQVQAFVSEQRLRFAALLKRLGFTSERLQKFDLIHATYQQAMLESPSTASTRQLARETRDDAMRELFGPNFDQWVAANRDQPARSIVEQIVQQTFQGSGALTSSQADELTLVVARHRLPPAKEAGSPSPGYDWDRIIVGARSILADRQMDDFVTAIEYRRTSEKMSAMATKKKS